MGLLDNKTEAATPKRREDARKKGQVVKSREIISVLVMLSGFIALRVSGSGIARAFREDIIWYLGTAIGPRRDEALATAGLRAIQTLMIGVLPVFSATCGAAVIGNLAQTGPMLITEPLKWDFQKLDPVQGVKRLFSSMALVELAKSTAKILLVGYVLGSWMRQVYPQVMQLTTMDIDEASQLVVRLLVILCWKAVYMFTLLAAVDYAWQRHHFEKSLMMTRQEVMDEFKQQEGRPEIKAAIRRRQRDISRGRQLQAVRKARVVVTNPTHYAIALVYDPELHDAPQVVARGQRLLALRIKEIAKEAGVPIVENPPLARALYAACDVGELVPAGLYQAVAEVLAFVLRLSQHRG